MPKLHLLKSEADFAQFRRGRQFQNSAIRIRITFPANQNYPRFGFIIPKKIVPDAVDRNKVKRRLKAILMKYQNHTQPADVLFFPDKSSIRRTFSDLEAATIQLLKLAHLWK